MKFFRKFQAGYFLAAVAVLVLAAALRLYQVDARPLHGDEGVNFHLLQETQNKGYYPYSHQNYHGPVHFYAMVLFTTVFGVEELGIRSTSIFFGVLAVALGFLGAPDWKNSARLLTASLLALSPSMIFFSRYCIHEMTLVFFELLFAFSLFRWLETERRGWLFSAAVSAAFAVATKETFLLFAAWSVIAAACAFLNRRPLDLGRRNKGPVVAASLLFVVVVVSVFSAGFRWSRGLFEMILALPQWFARGTSLDKGHFHPLGYYVRIIYETEPLLFFIPLIFGLILALPGLLRLPRAGMFSSEQPPRHWIFWSVLTIGLGASYSLIPYKNPWLALNITAPALVLCAVCLHALVGSRLPRAVRLGRALVPAVLLVAFLNACRLNYRSLPVVGTTAFLHPYGEHNPFSYVHTGQGMLDVVKAVREYSDSHPGSRILVAINSYWPLPYYLRDLAPQIAYIKPVADFSPYADEYAVLITPHTTTWRDPRYTSLYRRLSDVAEALVFFRTTF